MDPVVWKSPYPSQIIEVRLAVQARTVIVVFNSGSLTLEAPRDMASLFEHIDDCFELRIIDRNLEDQAQLEFGKYRLEVWDEDNPLVTVICDAYSVDWPAQLSTEADPPRRKMNVKPPHAMPGNIALDVIRLGI